MINPQNNWPVTNPDKGPELEELIEQLKAGSVDCAIHKKDQPEAIDPTFQIYSELRFAYQYFQRIFETQLPDCVITLQRKANTLGYFCGARFGSVDGKLTDEIALNPGYLKSDDKSILSTLVHEMVHLWQHHFGKAGRRGYHNREFFKHMCSIGLYPSHDGEPGGKEVGDRMSHYIVTDGPFDIACKQLIDAGFVLSWFDAVGKTVATRTARASRGTDGSLRWKYTCVVCGNNAWGKPEMNLVCGSCPAPMRFQQEGFKSY